MGAGGWNQGGIFGDFLVFWRDDIFGTVLVIFEDLFG